MKIQYEVTIDDFLDTVERLLARSKVAHSWRIKSVLLSASLSGLLVFAFTFVLWRSILAGLGGGLITAILTAILAWDAYPNKLRKQQRKFYQEQLGNLETTLFEVELSPSGIWTRQLGSQISFEWSNVEEVQESADAFEFYMFNGGGVFVKKRAFLSAEGQQQFIKTTHHYLNLSRTASNWMKD